MTEVPGAAPPSADAPPAPFADLGAFAALRRTSGLVLSPDGSRLVTRVAELDGARARYASALWQVDPTGVAPARRLTRSEQGESSPAFTAAGDLLFTSARPAPEDGGPDEDAPAALWRLPAAGGDAQRLARRPGGITGVVAARASGRIVVAAPTLPSATDAADDERRRARRREAGASGVLHTTGHLRHWDHDLGPDARRLLAGDLADHPGGEGEVELRDLTGHVAGAVGDEAAWSLTPDGATAVTTWLVDEPAGDQRSSLVAIEVATGARRVLVDDPDVDHASPLVSPDGSRVVVQREHRPSPEAVSDARLAVVDLATGAVTEVATSWDRWPVPLAWTPDSAGVVVAADDGGRCPLFHVDLAAPAERLPGARVTRLTGDDGAYGDAAVSPDGAWVYALRSAVDAPPAPVRLPLVAALASDGGVPPEPLRGPAGDPPELPGTLTEVTATAADGAPLRAWLALPSSGSGPAPLLLWIHGGPLSSWNAWSWRWNPWLAVARGYAVLLPDPALSTGYGLEHVRRGWNAWGGAPYTDLMAITDAALARDDLDATRTAAMGGSFGGYMANWVAGHTDRFAAIVTHASLWALDQFATTTDHPAYWARVLSPAALHENSPHHHAAAITTPLLVVHGDRDDRVPVGEALRLWRDLTGRSATPDAGPHRYLYFPDEHHWVLGPGNARLWYDTVFAFLAEHVLGEDWERPEALG